MHSTFYGIKIENMELEEEEEEGEGEGEMHVMVKRNSRQSQLFSAIPRTYSCIIPLMRMPPLLTTCRVGFGESPNEGCVIFKPSQVCGVERGARSYCSVDTGDRRTMDTLDVFP